MVLKRTLKTSSIKPLILDSSTDHISINDFFILLGTYGQCIQCIRHEIVDETGGALGKTVGSCKGGWINNGAGSTGKFYLMQDVFGYFLIGKPRVVEYHPAVTPQIRQAGNRLSGLPETNYCANLLA